MSRNVTREITLSEELMLHDGRFTIIEFHAESVPYISCGLYTLKMLIFRVWKLCIQVRVL